MYKLILNSKVFYIPSNLVILTNVNPDIYKELCFNQQYVVKSNININTFKNFIDYLVYSKIPDINKENFIEYDLLCNEFDRMKDLIYIYDNYRKNNNQIIDLNQSLHQKIQDCLNNFETINKSYFEIIQSLFISNGIQSYSQFLEIKKNLYEAFLKRKVKLVDLLTRIKIKDENGLTFVLNKKELSAGLFLNNKIIKENIIVPDYVDYQSQKYFVNANQFNFLRILKFNYLMTMHFLCHHLKKSRFHHKLLILEFVHFHFVGN